MARDSFERRKRIKLVFAVLAVGIVMSVIVAFGLIYMGQAHPHF